MGREYVWHDIDEYHAILLGPEPFMLVAVIMMEFGDPILADGRWIVVSDEYSSLNFTEDDIGLPLKMIKKRVIVNLGNELKVQLENVTQDFGNVHTLLSELDDEE